MALSNESYSRRPMIPVLLFLSALTRPRHRHLALRQRLLLVGP